MSSLNRVQARVATTVAVRAAPVNKAISPKNSPVPSRRGSGLSSISTSPAAMKYLQSPGSPRRTIVAPTAKPTRPPFRGFRPEDLVKTSFVHRPPPLISRKLSARFDADQDFVSSFLPAFARPPGEQPRGYAGGISRHPRRLGM